MNGWPPHVARGLYKKRRQVLSRPLFMCAYVSGSSASASASEPDHSRPARQLLPVSICDDAPRLDALVRFADHPATLNFSVAVRLVTFLPAPSVTMQRTLILS